MEAEQHAAEYPASECIFNILPSPDPQVVPIQGNWEIFYWGNGDYEDLEVHYSENKWWFL